MVATLFSDERKPSMVRNLNEERVVRPVFFDLRIEEDRQGLKGLRERGLVRFASDTLFIQLSELMRLRSPSVRLEEEEVALQVNRHLNGCPIDEYGNWVFYPWSGRLVHLLPESEFAEVRTSRNLFKIEPGEQAQLLSRKVGIMGLSAGNAAAMVLALQRSFGELRIADFDRLELSNMNRIRTGVHELGMSKVSITAREIAETDPYLKVKCFWSGITEENLSEFVEGDGLLDLLIDECDSPEIKVRARQLARSKGIPVVMETSDRGTLDVERYDLIADYPLFHGKLAEDEILRLLKEDPRSLVLKIFDIDNLSERGKASLLRIGKDITTWPQLAEDVLLGGSTVAKAARAILLGRPVESGRYYIDVNEIIASS